MKSFASDNYAGVPPALMDALHRANTGHARAYGVDEITQRCLPLFEQSFGKLAGIHFVFNGTGANVLSLAACTRSFEAVLCADISHIYSDEGTAPESFTGCRMFPVESDRHGKLQVAAIEERLARMGDPHYAQPRVLSLTQATEYGTLYTPEELLALADFAHRRGLFVHVDGARFFNAAASLNCSLRALSSDCGVDILSLGGAKLGMMYGEAVLVFHPELEKNLRFQHKQVMQLASKTRFISAQFEALLENKLWQSLAGHAHAMALMLAERLVDVPQVERSQPVQANAVFARIPKAWNERLMEAFPFYIWDESVNEARLMCAWDTQPETIDSFVALMKSLSQE